MWGYLHRILHYSCIISYILDQQETSLECVQTPFSFVILGKYVFPLLLVCGLFIRGSVLWSHFSIQFFHDMSTWIDIHTMDFNNIVFHNLSPSFLQSYSLFSYLALHSVICCPGNLIKRKTLDEVIWCTNYCLDRILQTYVNQEFSTKILRMERLAKFCHKQFLIITKFRLTKYWRLS